MPVIVNGNEYRTLKQPIYLGDGRQITEVWSNNIKVYPEDEGEYIVKARGEVEIDCEHTHERVEQINASGFVSSLYYNGVYATCDDGRYSLKARFEMLVRYSKPRLDDKEIGMLFDKELSEKVTDYGKHDFIRVNSTETFTSVNPNGLFMVGVKGKHVNCPSGLKLGYGWKSASVIFTIDEMDINPCASYHCDDEFGAGWYAHYHANWGRTASFDCKPDEFVGKTFKIDYPYTDGGTTKDFKSPGDPDAYLRAAISNTGVTLYGIGYSADVTTTVYDFSSPGTISYGAPETVSTTHAKQLDIQLGHIPFTEVLYDGLIDDAPYEMRHLRTSDLS